jgi:predicted O-linked N-acetylglucosamine transferase (SPINDLY family)
MPDSAFLPTLQQITAGTLGLTGLINAVEELTRAGRVDQADQIYKIWIGLNPAHPQLFAIYFNHGVLLDKSGDLGGAEAAFRAAIAQNPDFMPAYINLGGVLERSQGQAQAVAAWMSGVDHLGAHTGAALRNKALILKQISRVMMNGEQPGAAEVVLQQCLELDPHQRDAIGQYVPLRLNGCKWPAVAPTETLDRAALMGGLQPLSIAAYTDDPLLQLSGAWRHVKLDINERPRDHAADRRKATIDLSGRRMRIGYVSSDLRDHAIGYLMAELFELHDRSQAEVFAYYCGVPSQSDLTHRIKAAVEHWVDIRDLDDDASAARIAADQIDILVDVNGLTKDAKTAALARRPAPIQVNWLGFPGSMGTPYHHYIIADEWIIPPEYERYYSEKVVRLPCYQSNDRKRVVASDRPTRIDAGLPQAAFVFCCFNGHQKITRFTFDRWIAILSRTPDSVLWLLSSAPETEERLTAYAAERGIDRSRLIFAPKQPNALHMARYPLADLFLDTSPYGAHTTASDALWMGVPVLTLSGRSFAARVCGSLVRAAGLPELVCTDPADYVELAVALAADPERLKGYRQRLQDGRDACVLFDMEGLTSQIEGLYRTMCAEHQAGRTPQPDLRNLETYFEAGIEDDHEAQEILALEDYEGYYRAKLARRHRIRPIPADDRLWTSEAILAAEADDDTSPAEDAEAHPLLRLGQLYDAACLLLCQPLTPAIEAQIESLLAETVIITMQAPEGSEWAGWEKHYRLLIEAVDLGVLRQPVPVAGPEPEVALATSSGEPLDWAGLALLADRLGVQAVFFAAADEAYIDLYARLYIQSILSHCDVPCLVVVHVIGGIDRLQAIAARLGINDERLVFAGDGFDAGAVTTLCYDSPPKGLIALPVAHFQSVRFMRLGRLLRTLKRPVFVSDIDLLLQQGVSDLLLRCAQADVVFNEHHASANAGSRLTANLLLLNPTAEAEAFLDFLSGYLQSMLSRSEVTRWIDQFGLLMARHYLQQDGRNPNIQYFDTNLDINNVMYRTYEPNPFRFLSLYHGFDMSSLAPPQAEPALG